MRKLLLLFILLSFNAIDSISQGPSSCACVWSDAQGNLHCSFGNCGGQNWSNCYNQVSTPNLWQTTTCPNPPTTNCNPYMWNTSANGSCWYQGAGCSGQAVCEYVNNPLPVELIKFEGKVFEDHNLITWSTASENNSSHFILQNFIDTNSQTILISLPAAGNSSQEIKYIARHEQPEKKVNYYFLIQIDFDGQEKYYGPICIDNRVSSKKIIKTINLLGQEVDEYYTGVVIEIYEDWSAVKKYVK